MARIATATSLDAVKGATVIVEAATERKELKLQIFRDLDAKADAGAILATNTSSISITEIAAVTKRPESVIGMHFMNPVPVMQLVEVIRGLATSDAVNTRTIELSKALGKVPVEANDFPGFIANRILMPMINEACYAVMEGVGTPGGGGPGDEARHEPPDGPADARRLHRPRHLRRDPRGAARRARRPEVPPLPAAQEVRRRRLDRPQVGPRLLHLRRLMELLALTEEQRAIRDTARAFADEHVRPFAAQWDRDSHFEPSLIPKLGELGFLGMLLPAEYDGLALDARSYLIALEEIARADASVAVMMSVHNSLPTQMLKTFANEAQKQRFLAPMARGELLGAFALSEPDAGSDASAIRCQAVRDGDDWILDGTKAWVTSGTHAGVIIAMVRTDTPEDAASRRASRRSSSRPTCPASR
jgi:hypothetical protein